MRQWKTRRGSAHGRKVFALRPILAVALVSHSSRRERTESGASPSAAAVWVPVALRAPIGLRPHRGLLARRCTRVEANETEGRPIWVSTTSSSSSSSLPLSVWPKDVFERLSEQVKDVVLGRGSIRSSQVSEIREELMALLAAENESSPFSFDSGVPARYNLTFTPEHLWLRDLRERDGWDAPGAGEVILHHARVLLERIGCLAPEGPISHEANRVEVERGQLMAWEFQPLSGRAELRAPPCTPGSGQKLCRGDVIIMAHEDWEELVRRNCSMAEGREESSFGRGVASTEEQVTMRCQVYDVDGRHTQLHQEALRRALAPSVVPTLEEICAGWDQLSAPAGGGTAHGTYKMLPSVVKGLQSEAEWVQASERARHFNFLSKKQWRAARRRSPLIDRWAQRLEAYLALPVAGLFYMAPVPELLGLAHGWHALPQKQKLRLQSVAQHVEAGRAAEAEAEGLGLLAKLRSQEASRRAATAALGGMPRKRWRRASLLLAILAARLLTVSQNLCFRGYVEVLDETLAAPLPQARRLAQLLGRREVPAAATRLRVTLSGALQQHKAEVLSCIVPLEVAYLCLGSTWTPLMYIVPATYRASNFAAGLISGICSLLSLATGVLSICQALIGKVYFIKQAASFLDSWLLTPLLRLYIALDNLARVVLAPLVGAFGLSVRLCREKVQPLLATTRSLVKQLSTTIFDATTVARHTWGRLVRGTGDFFQLLQPLIEMGQRLQQSLSRCSQHVRVLARRSFTPLVMMGNAARWITSKIHRPSHIVAGKLPQYPGILLRALKGWAVTRRRREEAAKKRSGKARPLAGSSALITAA